GFARRVFGHVLHRKMVAVAQPHAKGDAMTGGAATFTNAFVSECCRRNSSRHRRGRRMFLRAPRRLPTPRAAKQKIKKSLFGAGRLRSDQQKYGHQHSDDDCRRPECELPVCRASARDLTALTHGNPLRPFSSTVRSAPPILRRIARATTRRSNRVILNHLNNRHSSRLAVRTLRGHAQAHSALLSNVSGGAEALKLDTLGSVSMTPKRLSEQVIKDLPIPSSGNRVIYFAGATIQGAKAPRGFGVRVTAAGSRAFILNYRLRGREYRFTIGGW